MIMGEKIGPGTGKSIVVLGIDPGLASTGVGIIIPDGAGGWRRAFSAHVITRHTTPMPKRLEAIHRLVADAVEEYKPTVAVLESIFFARNVKSAVLMAHGRGAAILASSQRGIPIAEYSPLEIKQSVLGKGRGSKEQVKQMVSLLLNLKEVPASDHETDALACALTHVYRSRLPELLPQQPASEEQSGNKMLLAMAVGRKRRRR